MRTGLSGVVALGTNGEAALLDEDESDRVIAAARDRVPADRLLLAGCARESTQATVRAVLRAADLGADGVLVRTPAFFKAHMTGDALEDHYRAVADRSPVPVLLYNFTSLTGVSLPVQSIARLADHPNIAGIKESDGDVVRLGEIVAAAPPDFAVFAGSATAFYAGLCAGACGGILALACVLPDLCVELYGLVRSGRHAEAQVLQRRLTPVARAVTSSYGIAGLKAALDLAGYRGGPPRAPLRSAPATAIADIRALLAALASEHQAAAPIASAD
jgi:4-hydroxy-2-oxoglutarate aldolase